MYVFNGMLRDDLHIAQNLAQTDYTLTDFEF